MGDIKAVDFVHNRIKQAHSVLSRHPETCLYGAVMLMGESTVVDKPKPFTACTDGRNKFYGAQYLSELETQGEINFIVLHENLHVGLNHIPRFASMVRKDPNTMNRAMDYVVNGIIENIKDKKLVSRPEGGLYDPMFDGWSVTEVYEYLRKKQESGDSNQPSNNKSKNGSPSDGKPKNGPPSDNEPKSQSEGGGRYEFDKHDVDAFEKMSKQEAEELKTDVGDALRAGGILAGRFGANTPRAIDEALEAKEDWRRVTADFMSNAVRGCNEYTWRKMNRRWLAEDIYRPSMEDETLGEVIVGIDTSGSIEGSLLSRFVAELASICEGCQPEKVRVLWWDTCVHGEQVFDEQTYTNIRKLLKPVGGGGTKPGCVSQYMNKNRTNAQCVIMLSDGYFGSVEWTNTTPVLWLVIGNGGFAPPVGHKVVRVDREDLE